MSTESIQSKYIHIDSRNRSQKSNLIKESDIKLGENPLLFTNNSNTIVIYHVNHGFTNKTLPKQIIINNITADSNNLICNYPKDQIEYNPLTNSPIFQIDEIKNDNGSSNYYTIKIPSTINISNIQTGRTGGSNIIINVVKETAQKIYSNPNNYKIEFGETCKNVVGMRLVSTEIPNVSYNIKQSGTNKNNCLYWVNENEGRYISDKIAVSDQIYLNSINKTSLLNADANPDNYPTSPDKFQTNISSTVTDTINSSYSNISSYIHITKNKLSQFHTPANLFDTNHFLDNNFHLIGNTLVNYIRTNTNDHTKFKQYLPWEFNYYVQYSNGSGYNTDINYVPDILGYQIFDIKTSNLNNLKFQEYITNKTYINNNIIPKTNIDGGSFMIENINTNYLFTNTLTLKYPIHSLYLNEGIYNTIDEILDNINYKLNTDKKLNYSWKLRDWVEETKSNKFTNNKKNRFDIQLNKQTEIIEFRQYEDISNYSSLFNKPINKQETIGTNNLTILTNDGLSEIAIKNKGHLLNTGNLLKINTPSDIYNLSSNYINNQEHILKVNPVYEIELRVIFPVLSNTYYGVRNSDITNANLSAYQINKANLGNEFDASNPDTTKLLKDYFGEDNFKYLNKGSFQSMLKYIGSKLVNSNIKNISGSNQGGPVDNMTYNTSSSNLLIKGPENPFLQNELIVKYDELQSFDGHMVIGRINHTTNTDLNGNVSLQYECLTQIEKGNFKIGDFLIGMNSNCIAMVVPYNWEEPRLPSKLHITSRINWVRQIRHADENIAINISTDSNGNIYLIGHTEGDIETPSSTNSDKDLLFIKYNSSGKELWKKQIGPAETDKGYSIKVDSSGNFYVLGTSEGDIVNTNTGNKDDIYLAKYDTNGTALWQIQIKTADIDIGYSLDLDSANNVYIVGSSKADLDAGGSETHAGLEDIIIAKYNTSGVLQWLQQYGTARIDIGTSIVVDSLDNIYITGHTVNTDGNYDIIIKKINSSNGNATWEKTVASTGTAGNDYSYGITTDDLGYIYICGHTSGNLISPFSPFSNNDVFIGKYATSDGAQQWIRQFGTHLQDETIFSSSIIVDSYGNIYIGGHTLGNLETNNKDQTKNDLFIMKLNSDGEEQWKEQIGTSADDKNISLTSDLFGNIYVAGITKGNLGLGHNLTKLGNEYDLFLMKLYSDNNLPIKQIKNGSENITITTPTPINYTNIDGLEIDNFSVHKPIRFSILWGAENTLQKQLGFLNNKQGKSLKKDSNGNKLYEEDLKFEYVNSNTKDVDEIIVTRSTFFNFYNDNQNNYLLLECEKEVPYEIGDTVYLKNHSLNYYHQKETKYRESSIQNIYPFSNWLYSLETEKKAAATATITLTASDLTGGVAASGSVTITNIANLASGDKVALVTTDGTTITATIGTNTTTTDTNDPTFQIGADVNATATNLANCLNPNSKISALASGATVTITQVTLGAAGNTTITLTDSGSAGMSKSNFSNGITGDTIQIITSDSTIITAYVTPNGGATTSAETIAPTFAIVSGNNNSTAANLNTCLNAHSKISTSVSTNVVTITQAIVGSNGNTAITTTNAGGGDGIAKTDFTGGGYGNSTQTTISTQTIENIKQWFYQNISKWTNNDEVLFTKIMNQYYYSKNKIYKIYVQETHGDGFQSKVFQKNMSIYDANNSNLLMGTVLGITKINTTIDKVYNESKVTDITDITKNSYYFIYFKKNDSYNLTNLKAEDVITFDKNKKQIASINVTTNVLTITSHGFQNDECVVYNKIGANGIGGLISGNSYFIINKTANTFQLSLTNTGFTRNQQNSVLTLSDVTVNLGSGSITNGTYTIIQSSTNGSGKGFMCSATFSSNATTAITILNGGSGYTAGNTITFTNQNGETNSLVLTIDTVGDVVINGGNAIDLTLADTDTGPLLDTLHRSVTREASAVIKTFTNPPYSSTPLYLDARYDYLYYFYFANKVIIDYKTNMTDKELEHLGNCGYLGNNSIDLNRNVDINYNILPLNTVKPGETIYIYNHQKAVPKYFEESDVLDTNPELIETIQNDYDESVVKTSVDETNNYKITGIKDGAYKALINLWPGEKANPYLTYKYRPGKTVLLDLDWNAEIEEGYMNKGSMRTLNSSISIVGDNKKVANTAEISSVIDVIDPLSVTDVNTKGKSKIKLSSATGFTAKSVVFINTKTFTNNVESSYANNINIDTTEMNIILSISTNTLTLKYPLINNHNYANTKVIQRYTTSFVTTSSAAAGQKNIIVGAGEYGNFSVGDIIIVDWNTKDANSNNIEEIHRIASKPGSNTLTVEENLLYTHTTDCCIVNLGNTTIRDTMLSTQNILINNEWYTKVFYQGHDCIEPQGNTEYKTGVPCFHKYAKQTVYINGMNGIQIPNMSLMTNRDTAYSEVNKINNTSVIDTSLTQENFNVSQIKPLTAGFYETYPNLLKDKVSLLTDYYNLSIPGNFSTIRTNFSSELVWNEKTTYQSADNLEYNCILIKGKFLGYGGKIEFREKTSILENPNGFKVLQKIKDTTLKETKVLIDLKISDINLNTNISKQSQKVFHNLAYNNQVPSSVFINNYNKLKSKTFLKQDITIGTGGIVYQKVKNGAINLSGENYINLCFPSLGGKQTENKQNILQTSQNTNQDVFAKILLPDNSGNILFNTFVSSPKIFQTPISKLTDLLVKFIDNDGNEYDFQGKEHSFTLEIFQQICMPTFKKLNC